MPDSILSVVRLCVKCSTSDRYINGRCKKCTTASRLKWVLANPEKNAAAHAAYLAKKPIKKKTAAMAWNAANREEVNRQSRARQAANPEINRKASAKWRAANPDADRRQRQTRRARKMSSDGKLSKGIVLKLYKLQKGMCPCCEKPLENDYHLDHIMPLALGGRNTDDNAQLLRSTCNLQKRMKHPVDFMQQRGFLL